MDVSSVQKFPLSHLDFKNEKKSEFENLPSEVLKSATLETLFSQNEETLNRLKVSLRRQSRLENEVQQLKSDIEAYKSNNQSLQDQIFIHREKDKAWKKKLEEMDIENQILKEKDLALTQQNQTLTSETQRFQKYQEKIKTQVRPYIQQLKEYSRALEDEKKNKESELLLKDSQLASLRQQMTDLIANLKAQIEIEQRNFYQATESYEQDRARITEENRILKEANVELEAKNSKLEGIFQEKNLLENTLIETQRSKETQKSQLESEVLRLQEINNQLHKENCKLNIEFQDLKEKVLSDTDRIKDLERSLLETQNQLEGLRYMWNAKNQEAERMKISLTSLEKLNLDLSLKVQELRTQRTSQPNYSIDEGRGVAKLNEALSKDS